MECSFPLFVGKHMGDTRHGDMQWQEAAAVCGTVCALLEASLSCSNSTKLFLRKIKCGADLCAVAFRRVCWFAPGVQNKACVLQREPQYLHPSQAVFEDLLLSSGLCGFAIIIQGIKMAVLR